MEDTVRCLNALMRALISQVKRLERRTESAFEMKFHERAIRPRKSRYSHPHHSSCIPSSASDICMHDTYTHTHIHMSIALLMLAGCPRDDWLLRWRRRAALWL